MNTVRKFLGFFMVAVILVGCAQATPTTEPVTTAPATDGSTTTEHEAVTLSFLRPGLGEDAQKETDAQFAPFHEKYPWITIDTTIALPPELATKLQTSIAGGLPPDVVMAIGIGDAIKYENSGQLLDLTPYAEAEGFDWKNYYDPDALAYFNPNGKLQCVAETSDTRVLAYNKDMFDAAGLAYPTDDWTWNDLVTAAQALTKDTNSDGQIDQWGFATQTWDDQPWIWAAGASLYNQDYSEILITDPVVKKTYQFLADLRFKYNVWPPNEVLATFPEVGFMFAQGQLAMYPARWLPDTIFFFAGIPINWDVAMFPKNPDTGLRAASKGGGCIGVFAATPHPEEAYLWWRWITSDEGVYARSVGSNGIPALPGGPASSWPLLTAAFDTVKTPANAKAFIEMQPYTRFSDLPIDNAAEVYAAISPFMDEFWLGTKSIDELAPEIKAAVDPLLK
jgi:multiple sugar transport system substrate-binding protein